MDITAEFYVYINTYSTSTSLSSKMSMFTVGSPFFYIWGGVVSFTRIYLNCTHVVQCLIKKDKDDQNDATMDAFYQKLVTAYRDPALSPIQITENNDSHSSPLLQGTEV